MLNAARRIGLMALAVALAACGPRPMDLVCQPTGERAVKPDPNPVFARRAYDETRSVIVERHTCSNGHDMWLRPVKD